MNIHLDIPVSDKCWNFYDSYGQICVHCGCCSKDKITRYKARLKCCKEWLKETEEFNGWAYDYPDLLETQKKNVASDIAHFKRKIRYYEKKLNEQLKNT